MKQLQSYDELRQERYEHDGHTYSIVDLTIPPLEANGTRAEGRFTELMEAQYGAFKYELADTTDIDNIVILQRFSTIEAARTAITTGYMSLEWEMN